MEQHQPHKQGYFYSRRDDGGCEAQAVDADDVGNGNGNGHQRYGNDANGCYDMGILPLLGGMMNPFGCMPGPCSAAALLVGAKFDPITGAPLPGLFGAATRYDTMTGVQISEMVPPVGSKFRGFERLSQGGASLPLCHP
jgi:hypothetical protein